MSLNNIDIYTSSKLEELRAAGTLKGAERVICAPVAPREGRGPLWLLEGQGARCFLAMNSNSYLGLSFNREVLEAGEEAARRYGAGPGAVRFISGTSRPHIELEERLAEFHGREAAMIFSAAYSAMMGVLPGLLGEDAAVFSDELNHSCIINALRLGRPGRKVVYPHLDTAALARALGDEGGKFLRSVVVSDGVFSMRGDHADLGAINGIARRHAGAYPGGVVTVVDDSHGVGCLGRTGRGTEEETGGKADLLVATLGKALGVNGGYATASRTVIEFLRETSPLYVYSNPITPGEAAAALQALRILDGTEGRDLLRRLREATSRFRTGLAELGFEVLPGEHPIVPLMVRDTDVALSLVNHLFGEGILATAIKYPVVPRGSEEVRFQVSASHTDRDIDTVLESLDRFRRSGSRR